MEEVAVLLVDDDSNFAISLENKLADQRMRIHKVSKEAEILSETQKNKIDVIILNTVAADLNGLEILSRIKRIDPLVEVILCTDQADLSVAIKGMEMGAFDYIQKSITSEELVYKISDACQKKRLQEEKIKNLKRTVSGKHR
jgi:DNA-binding NtrC family response regulator